MKITSVEQQKSSKGRSAAGRKNPHRYNIFLDGKFAFGADEDTVVKFRLVPGKEIQPPMLDKILFEAEVGKLMGRMYNLLTMRLRSEKEIRDYIRKLNFKKKVKDQEEISSVVIELLIENLKNKGLINDEAFARAWVESRRRSKQKGVNVLKSELFQKGIDREIIEEVTRVGSLESSEEQLAKETLEKKLKIWKNLSALEFRKKATEFLIRRGFNYSIAKEVVDNYLQKE